MTGPTELMKAVPKIVCGAWAAKVYILVPLRALHDNTDLFDFFAIGAGQVQNERLQLVLAAAWMKKHCASACAKRPPTRSKQGNIKKRLEQERKLKLTSRLRARLAKLDSPQRR